MHHAASALSRRQLRLLLARSLLLGFGVIAVALALAACGGGGPARGTPSPATTAESTLPAAASPAASAPPATVAPASTFLPDETQRFSQLASQVDQLVRAGFAGLSVQPSQVSDPAFATADGVLVPNLRSCTEDGPVVLRSAENGTPVALVFERTNPTFYPSVLKACLNVGQATKELFAATRRDEFRQANQAMKELHRGVFEALRRDRKNYTDKNWSDIQAAFYTLP